MMIALRAAQLEKLTFLISFHVAVDHPHTPGFQCIGRTLRTDA